VISAEIRREPLKTKSTPIREEKFFLGAKLGVPKISFD
jgi:hypothetical protein